MTEAEQTMIHEIEQLGFKVKFSHVRRWTIEKEWFAAVGRPFTPIADIQLDPRGGYCEAIAVDKSGEPYANAIVVCSNKDNYVKRVARMKALGRLKAALSTGKMMKAI